MPHVSDNGSGFFAVVGGIAHYPMREITVHATEVALK
jgi:hypothetical protein